jgi:hypothetical protein
MWGSAAAIVLAGWLIGATGIGGVLVVPVLHEMHGMDLRSAIATASLALGFPGIPALWRLLVARPVLPEGTPSLLVASIPGAVVGALLVQYVNLNMASCNARRARPLYRRVGPARTGQTSTLLTSAKQ